MDPMVSQPQPTPTDKMSIAVVGGGRRCLSLLQILESQALKGLQAQIVGVADKNPTAVGFAHAAQAGIFVTLDYRDLLAIPGLEMVINLTGSRDICPEIDQMAPDSVTVLPYPASRLFQEIVQEVLIASRLMDQQADVISRSESFARAMAQATIVGVMVLDTNYRINWINEAALKAARLTREEAIGQYCFQVSHQQITPCASADSPCPMKETLATGLAAHSIHEHRQPGGQITYCDVSTYPLFNRDGGVEEVVEVIRDITANLNDKLEERTHALKDNLARLVQEDKLIALGKLVASVSHEINNPIGSIINFAKLIKETLKEGAPSPEQMAMFDRYLELTVREAQRCGKIVSNLLSFSRQQAVEPKIIDLCEIVERILALTRHRMELSNINLVWQYDQESLEVWGDYTQIQQCLTNLVFNAMEAMPDGGRLTIHASRDEENHQVQLEVSDTGLGISAKNMPHIFEPFFTTKTEGHGVGLGLSMVYGIIREHRGEISVCSEEGRGASFLFSLPDFSGSSPG